MEVWHYSGTDRLHALTNNASGANLPEHLGPWRLVGAVVLRDTADDEREAMELIDVHGFCCFE